MRSTRNLPAIQFKAGTLIAVGVTIALLGVIFPTKGINPFSRKFIVFTQFSDIGGLRTSSPVWFSGVEVGEVTKVDFLPDANQPRLQVVMRIEKRVYKYIKTDSTAQIKTLGLMGDTYVDIRVGSDSALPVGDRGTIPGEPPQDLQKNLNEMMASAKELLNNLEQISRDIREGQGTLGRLVQDPSMYQDLQATVRELQKFIEELNTREGTLQKLYRDPELYDELTAAVKDIRQVASDLRHAEEKILSPETRQTLDETVKTASRVIKRVGEYQEKMDRLRFDLSFGLSKYEASIAGGHAHLQIWPNADRYYILGLQKVSELYGLETEKTTFDAQLGWRILQTPLFIRGGLIRDEFFVAGLDLRLFEEDFSVLLDTYRVEYNPVQLDVRTGVVMLDLIELTAGVEDVLRTPFYKAGLTIHFRDDDLLTVLMKSLF